MIFIDGVEKKISRIQKRGLKNEEVRKGGGCCTSSSDCPTEEEKLFSLKYGKIFLKDKRPSRGIPLVDPSRDSEIGDAIQGKEAT